MSCSRNGRSRLHRRNLDVCPGHTYESGEDSPDARAARTTVFGIVQNSVVDPAITIGVSANLGSALSQQLRDTRAQLRIEFGYVTVTELAELYRALAVTCVERQIARVLILAGDDEPAGERALRDAMTMMVLAGIPDDFRLALVAALPRTAQTYRNTPRDFNAAGITTRLFASEEDAVQWLDGSTARGGPRRAPR